MATVTIIDPLNQNQFNWIFGKSKTFINFAVMALALNQLTRIIIDSDRWICKLFSFGSKCRTTLVEQPVPISSWH